MKKFDVEYIKHVDRLKSNINRYELSEVELYEEGKKLIIPKEGVEDWEFTGLLLSDFVCKNIYKEKSIIQDDKLDFLLNHDYWLNSTECLKY